MIYMINGIMLAVGFYALLTIIALGAGGGS